MAFFKEPFAFDWDQGNRDKNLQKHGVTNQECEEVFFDADKKILKGKLHWGGEERWILLGKTKRERVLSIVFTLRGDNVRVISARDLNKKERRLYDNEETAENSEI